MADKLTPDTEVEPREHLTDEDFREAVHSVNSQKREATEANGEAAKFTRDFCDRYHINKQAFTTVAKLSKMEDQPAALSFIRDFVIGCRRMGMFAQVDALDDLIPAMKAIVEEAESGADMTRHGLHAVEGGAEVTPAAE